MPRPPPKQRRGISIIGLAGDDEKAKQQAAGILERRLKMIEDTLEDVFAVVSREDTTSITKIKGFFDSVPPPVNSTGAPGSSTRASHGDHTHRGVNSIFKTSAAAGEIIFDGAGVTQAGNTFSFPGIGAAVFGTPVDVGTANAAGSSTEFVRKDHVHKGVLSVNLTSAVSGALTFSGTGVKQTASDFFFPGVIFVNTTQTGNTAATETDLFNISVPAATLSVNGDTLDFFAFGTFGAGVSADKRLRVYFGAATVFDSGALAIVSADWRLEGQIIRTGAATQKAILQIIAGLTTIPFAPIDFTSPTETLSGAVTLRITGAGTNANDVVGEAIQGRLCKAP